MSFFNVPHNFFRDSSSFVPQSMIDTLFDYGKFLQDVDAHGIAPSVPGSQKTVAIIGAGISGLICAYELSRIQNINVKVYEMNDQSDSVAGRMYSIHNPDAGYNDKIFEMGCMRFPPTSYSLFHYLNKFNIQTTPNFPDPGKVPTTIYYENSAYNWNPKDPAPGPFTQIAKDFSTILKDLIGDPSVLDTDNPRLIDYWSIYQSDPSTINLTALTNSWQSLITAYKDVTFYEAIFTLSQQLASPWKQEDMNAFGALGVGSGGFGPLYEVNFLEILRIMVNGWENGQEFVVSGISSLATNIISSLPSNVSIKYSTQITGITKVSAAGVTYYQLIGNNGVQGLNFDAVIVATTTPAMEYMGLTMPNQILGKSFPSLLSSDVQVALRNLHLMSSSKLFILTKTKFWYLTDNLPYNIQTDEALRGLYCLDYDPTSSEQPNTEGYGVVLVSYVWGDDSTRLQALTANQRYNIFLERLKIIDNDFATQLENNVISLSTMECIDWQSTAGIYGAFKLNYPGQEQANSCAFFQYQQEEQGLFIAGDSVSYAGGWMEGAITTALNAACGVARYLNGDVIAGSPLEIVSTTYNYS